MSRTAQITPQELRRLLEAVCRAQRLTAEQAAIVAENYLEAELIGKDTHGISKFIFESVFFTDRTASPEVVLDAGPLLKLDGHQEVGPVAAAQAVDLAADRAKKYGLAMVGLHNIQRYGILRTWVRRFEAQQMFGIIMNTCEPAMAGPGGQRAVLGSNPLAFGVPTPDGSYITDMATSEVAMTTKWKALRQGSLLPEDTFLDADGAITRDPAQAQAVKNFGGIKGFSLALLIQVMTGPLFGFKTGSAVQNMYDIGHVFLAIDPNVTSTYDEFVQSNAQLLNELRISGATVPGSRSHERKEVKVLKIDSELLIRLQAMAGFS